MAISISTAKDILSLLVKAQMRHARVPTVLIKGPPGCGKSDIVREVAEELGIEMRDIRLAQMDPVDIRGVPMVEDRQTKWAVPSCFPNEKDSKQGILFLDELTSADPSIQVAAYQLILDRKIGEYEVPSEWYICAAGNRSEDQAVVQPMSSALANRMMHLEIEPNSDAWLNWALGQKIDPILIAFIKSHKNFLFQFYEQDCEKGWPSPRSWSNVSAILQLKMPFDTLKPCVQGLVGFSAAEEFLAYRENVLEMGDVKKIMLAPDTFKLPKKADQRDVLTVSIVQELRQCNDDAEVKKLLDGFVQICLQLPPVYANYALQELMRGNTSHGEQLANHPDFEKLKTHAMPSN